MLTQTPSQNTGGGAGGPDYKNRFIRNPRSIQLYIHGSHREQHLPDPIVTSVQKFKFAKRKVCLSEILLQPADSLNSLNAQGAALYSAIPQISVLIRPSMP